MFEPHVSEQLRQFLRECIETHEDLETLMLLVREHEAAWPPDRVASALGGPAEMSLRALERLTQAGLLSEHQAAGQRFFRFAPSADLRAPVAELLETYGEHRLPIMNEISSNAVQRVRTAAMRAFARAFLLDGKGKDRG